MRILKLTLGKIIFMQIFLQFMFFSVKRLDGLLLRPDVCGLDGRTVRGHVRTRVVSSYAYVASRVRTG